MTTWKKTILLLFFLGSTGIIRAQSAPATGINFQHQNWEEVIQAGKQQGKPVLISFYASWCGVCQKLKRNTLTDDKLGQWVNTQLLAVDLDVDTPAGKAAMKQWRVSEFPTLVLVGKNGKLLSKSKGFVTAKELEYWAQAALAKQ